MRSAADNDAIIGLWHEAYVVRSTQTQMIYYNLPPIGLERAAPGLRNPLVSNQVESSR